MATPSELDEAALADAEGLANGVAARPATHPEIGLSHYVRRLVPALRAARQRIAELEAEIPAWAAYDKTEGWHRDGLLAIGNSLNAKDARIAELEDALREIAIAPCMYALLGEPETCEHSCPGCRARKALVITATPAALEGNGE